MADVPKNHFQGASNLTNGELERLLKDAPSKEGLAAVTPIADTSTATTQEIGDKLNELIAALKA